MSEKWYNLTEEQTAARLRTDVEIGLDPRQVRARLRREGRNILHASPKATVSRLFTEVLKDPCAYILLVCAVLAWIFGEGIGARAIIALTLINAAGVFLAYIKARRVIEDAEENTHPTATVLRGGKQYIVRQDRICRGDIIILNKGDVVPADARVIMSKGLTTIETNLTGDTAVKHKDQRTIHANNLAFEKQADMVFATTLVSGGSGRAVVCRTGSYTLAYSMSRTKESRKESEPGILGSLKKHASFWSFAMLVLIFVLTLFDFIVGLESRGFFEVFMTGLCLAAACMCEYYLAFGYIIVGYGLYRMTDRKKNVASGAIVKKIDSIEKLSGITSLIVQKDGAFTSSSVHIKNLWCDSTLLSPGDKLSNICPELLSCALDSTVYPYKDFEKVYNRFKAREVSAQDRAILSLAMSTGIFDGLGYIGTHNLLERSEEGIIKSLVRVSGQKRLIIRGAAEDILPLCHGYRSSENIKSIKYEKKRVAESAAEFAKKGISVICMASMETEFDSIDEAYEEGNFIFEGFLAINEPWLSGADANVKRLKEAGIKVFMLASDHFAGNRLYARKLGIIESDSDIMPQELLSARDDVFVSEIVKYRFAEGLSFHHRRLLLRALRQMGEKVGYFGNDFDDMLLVKEADIGYSTGVTLSRGDSVVDLTGEHSAIYIRSGTEKNIGCEAVKQICDVVISPADGGQGGFNAIAGAIACARRVFTSISAAVKYLMVSQFARLYIFLCSVLLPAFGITFTGGEVLSPVQMLFLGYILDFGIVLVFAFKSSRGKLAERTEHDSQYRYIREMVVGALWGFVAIVAPLTMRAFGVFVSDMALSTAVFFGFILTQVITALEMMTPKTIFNKNRISVTRAIGIFVLTLIFFILCSFVPFISRVFDTCNLPPILWLTVVIQPAIMLGVYEIYKLIQNRKTDSKEEESDDTDTQAL